MKKHLMALFTSTALLAGVPAVSVAHEGDRPYHDEDGAYGSFRTEFQHLNAGVRHGLRDGSFGRGEARQFYWAINSLRARLDAYWRNDGYLDRRERWDMRRRIAGLHNDMHDAHGNGHSEQDYGYYRDQGDDNPYDRGEDGYRRR